MVGGPYEKRNLVIRKLIELKYKQRDVTKYKRNCQHQELEVFCEQGINQETESSHSYKRTDPFS